LKREASSMMSKVTAEKPRTLSSLAAMPMMRDPFLNSTKKRPPREEAEATQAKSRTLRMNSRICCFVGAVTTMVDAGWSTAVCTAMSAAVVDLPVCRQQLRMTRLLERRKMLRCWASQRNPHLRYAK